MPDRPQQLAHLDFLGDATKFSGQIHALIPKCNLLENFSHAEVRLLTHFMDVYMCGPGAEIIRGSSCGDVINSSESEAQRTVISPSSNRR